MKDNEKLIEQIAKTCYQYAYLIDDKKIKGLWSSLSARQAARFYEGARTILDIVRISGEPT